MDNTRLDDKREIVSLEEAYLGLKFKMKQLLEQLLEAGRITEEEYQQSVQSPQLESYITAR